MTENTSHTPLRASVDTVTKAGASHEGWVIGRGRAVTAPTGNLALIETRWHTSDGPNAAEEQVGQPSNITVTDIQRTNPDTGAIETGVRLWDATSEAIQNFDHIDTFPFNPEWVVEAQFTPVDAERVIPFEHIRDNGGTRDLVVPGDISLTLEGEEYTLSAFDDNGTLLLVFADPTNGAADSSIATYSPGRFLRIPTQLARGEAGVVVLDFNRAFVPPCGFSPHYNCPLPPAQNRLKTAVLAGEKKVVNK
ncbi:DUF1684 domain-containing protein [Lysinibacter sp. HNR]|uniref:DUF1684 domain-containing protein n=1 Tax=Lysinibacter sp. HNR TaxID=3031408 RepID=UPI002434F4C5|nr:DUF1684 domain-containing protein [Lysinibacter sp. HNR]WGD37906.1 DUF1684 domain-containing protein [Lysinibacter sp. HNR]